MGFGQKYSVTVTTSGTSTATNYTAVVPYGYLHQINYRLHGTAPYSTVGDFTITTEDSSQTLWTQPNVAASAFVAPRQVTHDTTGGAALYAAGGTNVRDRILIVGERIKVLVADVGANASGVFDFIIG